LGMRGLAEGGGLELGVDGCEAVVCEGGEDLRGSGGGEYRGVGTRC
jgi:hypothetical protein